MPNSNNSNPSYAGRSAEEISGMRSGYLPNNRPAIPSTPTVSSALPSIPDRGAPGSMTQAQIDARNSAVIAHAAADNKNPQQNLYQQLYWRDKFPSQSRTLDHNGNYALTPYEAFGQQFFEPIRGAWRSLTGGEYYDSEADPYGDPSTSYWMDTVRRFNNSIDPNNPIDLKYPNNGTLDIANGSLIGSGILALTAASAAGAPSVASAVPTRLIPSLSTFAPIANSGINAALATFPRVAPLAWPAWEFLKRRGMPLARNLKDFYTDLTFPLAAFSSPASTTGGALGQSLLGAGAVYQGFDTYQHAMKEYGKTGNPYHTLRAAIRNQFTGAPLSPFGLVALPLGLFNVGASVAEEGIHRQDLHEDSKKTSPHLGLGPGELSLADPLVRDHQSEDPRRRQRALQELRARNPNADLARSASGIGFDLKQMFDFSDGSTATRDGELLISNLELLENNFTSAKTPELQIDAASKFTDSVVNNLINVRGYSPENITPEVIMQTVNDTAFTFIENIKTDTLRSYSGTEPILPLIKQFDGAYEKFEQTVSSSEGNDLIISLAYRQLMQDITTIQERRMYPYSRWPVTLPLPGE